MSEIDRAMLQSMAASFRGALDFSFNRHDMAKLMDRCASRTDVAQAAITAALEAAARVAEYLRDVSGRNQDGDFYVGEESVCFAGSVADEIASGIRALITQPQHDALAAHVAAEVAKARAEDAANVEALVATVERLNAACDAMWNDGDRLEENPIVFGPLYRLKEVHMKAISEAQQALPSALAPFARKGE